MSNQVLIHYGVPGMKWGHRKAQKFANKATNARNSAKEWDRIGKSKAAKLQAKGKIEKANKVKSKYSALAKKDRMDAKAYDNRSKFEKNKAINKANKKERIKEFKDERKIASKSRSRGAKLATNLLGGPFANKTYNSVIAAGGSKNKARAITAVSSCLGGPIGNMVVSRIYSTSHKQK